MKDLTKYIESLLDEVDNTCEINYVNNVYVVDVVRDYKYSVVMYKNMVYFNHDRYVYVNKILKMYLPNSSYVVRVKEINIPISFIPFRLQYVK